MGEVVLPVSLADWQALSLAQKKGVVKLALQFTSAECWQAIIDDEGAAVAALYASGGVEWASLGRIPRLAAVATVVRCVIEGGLHEAASEIRAVVKGLQGACEAKLGDRIAGRQLLQEKSLGIEPETSQERDA